MGTEVIASAKRDLNMWKLSLLQCSRSRAAHRVVQRTQFTLLVREMSKTCVETRSVGKDIGKWICYPVLKKKLQWITVNPPELMIFWH